MNRDTAALALTHMRNGRRIIVLAGTQNEARTAFAEVASHTTASENVRRANGEERVTADDGPGWIRFGPSSGNRFRGLTADIILVDEHLPDLANFLPAIAASPVGEVIIRP